MHPNPEKPKPPHEHAHGNINAEEPCYDRPGNQHEERRSSPSQLSGPAKPRCNKGTVHDHDCVERSRFHLPRRKEAAEREPQAQKDSHPRMEERSRWAVETVRRWSGDQSSETAQMTNITPIDNKPTPMRTAAVPPYCKAPWDSQARKPTPRPACHGISYRCCLIASPPATKNPALNRMSTTTMANRAHQVPRRGGSGRT